MKDFKKDLYTIIEAKIALFTFKCYTIYPRWLEITYGITAWVMLITLSIILQNLFS